MVAITSRISNIEISEEPLVSVVRIEESNHARSSVNVWDGGVSLKRIVKMIAHKQGSRYLYDF